MTINSGTGLIQWTPGSAGDFNVTVQASNGVNPPANQSFTIEVTSSSAPPEISSSPGTSAETGQLYSYDVNATGNPAPSYSLVTFPSGMTINSVSGLIQWTPSAAGDFNVEVQAANGVNPPDNQAFVIQVTEPGSPSCPPDIISYWKLDETSAGSYADFTGNNDGTSSNPPSPASGRVGGAQLFDGNNDQITIPADPSLDFGVSQSFSIEVWINHPSVSLPLASTEIIIGRYDPSTGMRWFLWVDRIDGRPVCYIRSTNGTEATIKGWPSVLDGQWHHLVVYRDASNNNIRMYMDGLRRITGNRAFTAGFTSSTAPVTIGWYTANQNYTFEGRIDEAALYNRVLTDAEITEHYNNGLSGLGYCSGSGFASNSISSGFDFFDASAAENTVNLQWKITSGQAAGFEIEKKLSEEKEWEKIDFVESGKEADLYSYKDNYISRDGNIYYRIKLLGGNGTYTYSETKEVIVLPADYQLFQNYPNPFNPVTTIKFSLPQPGNVNLKIFNQLGEEVLQLVNGHYESGYHEVQFNGSNLASGVYFYRLESGSFSAIMKSLLLK
jgi:hypothetical protein